MLLLRSVPVTNADTEIVSVQVIKAYREGESRAPLILNHGTRRKWSVPRPGGFTSEERGPGTRRIGGVSSRASMDV
jgi:hypothetical protein